MASYTQHYQLHQWEPTDDFLRTDFNTDLEKIDDALGEKSGIVTGSYTGNDAESQSISLGFHPQAVLVLENTGLAGTGGGTYEGEGLTKPKAGTKIKASCPFCTGWVSGSNPGRSISIHQNIESCKATTLTLGGAFLFALPYPAMRPTGRLLGSGCGGHPMQKSPAAP